MALHFAFKVKLLTFAFSFVKLWRELRTRPAFDRCEGVKKDVLFRNVGPLGQRFSVLPTKPLISEFLDSLRKQPTFHEVAT